MYIGRAMDIIDQETGEVYYTCHSKYGGYATLENTMQYCRRHGYKYSGLDTDSRGRVFMWVTQEEQCVGMPQHNWWEPGCEDMPKVAPKEQWLPDDIELPFM